MRIVLVWGALLIACGSRPPTELEPTSAPVAAPSSADAAASPMLDAGSGLDAGIAAACDASKVPPALAELPCVPDQFEARARPLGLSRDKRWFGRCFSSCETCGYDCAFVDLQTGRRKAFVLSDELRGASDAAHAQAARRDKPLLAFLEANYDQAEKPSGPLPRTLSGPFPYDDIVFAVKSGYDTTAGKATFALGARVAGEPAVYPFTMAFGPYELEPPVLATLDVSPDGKFLGFVAVSHGTRFVELGDMQVHETTALVGRLYNEAGFAAHRQARYGVSSTLFGKAAHVSDRDSLYAYNEACALARLGSAKAEEALGRAIRLGGRKVAVRARTDADFERVKSEPWFTTLTR